MFAKGLSALQIRVLELLAGFDPPWLLFGGGALVGVYGQDRQTRDLDLMWMQRETLADLPMLLEARLRASGLQVRRDVTAAAFVRDHVSDGSDDMELDLVADPTSPVEPPVWATIAGILVQVPTQDALLVDKLCAALGRSEARDVQDIAFLLAVGCDLEVAVARAPQRDGGFSALTLAWVLREMPLRRLGPLAGWDAYLLAEMLLFRDALVTRLVDMAARPRST